MNEALINATALAVLLGSPMIAFAVGVVYFIKANEAASFAHRILTSSFGPAVALMFPIAGVFWPDRLRYNPSGVNAFYWLQLLPLALLVLGLAKYPGSRRLHLGLVPLGLLAWAGTFAWGWLFIHGE